MTEFPIKPPLYLFDNDQTYDLLKFENVDGQISGLISDLGFEINGINLIDCFTPDGYQWADQWTAKFIDALWQLSRTHLLTNAEINGQAYGFEPQFKATIANTLGLPEIPESINLIAPKGKTVTITFLYKDLTPDDEGTGYPENLPPCNTWSKAARIYQAISGDLTIKLEPQEWLFNSCVITGGGELQTTNEVKKVLLYEFLDNTLALINSKVGLTECEVLSGISATVTTSPIVSQSIDRYPVSSIAYHSPLFQVVPENYYFCTLIKANNNAWNNGTIGEDIGKKLGIKYTVEDRGIKFYFMEGNTIFQELNSTEPYNNKTGYDLYDPTKPIATNNKGRYEQGDKYLVDSISNGFFDLITFTSKNNQSIEAEWGNRASIPNQNFNPTISTYPVIVTTPIDSSFKKVPSNVIGKDGYYFIKALWSNATGEFITGTSNTVQYSNVPPDNTQKIGLFETHVIGNQDVSSYFGDIRQDYDLLNRDSNSGLISISRSYRVYSSPFSIVIPFLGDIDPLLFVNGQIGLVTNKIDVKITTYDEFWSVPNPDEIGYGGFRHKNTVDTYAPIQKRITEIINIDYPIEGGFLVNAYKSFDEAINIPSDDFYPDIVQEVNLRRNLRIAETINIPDAIEVSNA